MGLSLAMCAGLVAPALAVTYDISKSSVTVTATGSTGWDVDQGKVAKSTNKEITVFGETTKNTITVTGAAAGTTITLSRAAIDLSKATNDCTAFSISGKSSNVIIELDGANTLTSRWGSGLDLSNGASVTIQDENGDGGSLAATGDRGIGGSYEETVGNITISGGIVTATGGIGSGYRGTVSSIMISGGKVMATSNGGDAAIGAGMEGRADKITITGGSHVTAITTASDAFMYDSLSAAGIGGGNSSSFDDGRKSVVGDIIITGGSTVTAIGGGNSAGIGSSGWGTASNIIIDGAKKVDATGGTFCGAGIGAGEYGTVGDIKISDSIVTATGYGLAPGIGGGVREGTVGNIIISGSKVTATGSSIGIGLHVGNGGDIIIQGNSNVTATSISTETDTIGGFGWVGDIIIDDSTVTLGGSGISSGIGARADTVTIKGGSTVTAIGNTGGILTYGGGDNGEKGNISIGDDVTLLALGLGWSTEAVTSYNYSYDRVTGNILLGEFYDDSVKEAVSSNSAFAVLDKKGNPILDKDGNPVEFNVSWEGTTYYSFGISLPEDENGEPMDCIIVQKDEAGNILNYVVYENDDGEDVAVYKTTEKSDDGSVMPMRKWNLKFKNATKYKFESEDGTELPKEITDLEKSNWGASVKVGDKVEIKNTGTKWTLTSLEKTAEGGVDEDGHPQETVFTGIWMWEPCDHSAWGAWKVSKPATCTEKGEEARTCGTCGKVESRDIDPLEHKKDGKSAISEVWSQNETEHWHECSLCHARFDTKEHSEVAVDAVTATCTEPGLTEGKKCSVCGKVLVEQEATTTDPDNHVGGNGVSGIPEEFTQDEEQHYKVCKLCGKEVSGSREAHDWSDWTETKPATCTEKGKETRTCGTCGKVENRDIAPLNHKKDGKSAISEVWSKDKTEHWHECSLCHAHFDKVCKLCGKEVSGTRGAHDWSDWTETKSATCTEKGEETRTCGTCGAVEHRDIDAKDRKEYTVELDPNGGKLPEDAGNKITATVGEDAPELPTPTRPGYDFVGWVAKDPSVTPEQASEGKGSIVMTAQWDGKNYNVIVDYGYEGAPEADPISGKVGGTTPKLPENPTRPGYDFNGWVVVDEDGNETEFNPDKFDPDGESVHLKATWTARPSTPEADVSFTPVETGTEIEDVVVPLAGLFTRADAIGYLWEQAGSPEWKLSDFADVPEDHQWAVAIGWAQDMGIAVADEDGNFRPDDLVLRSVEDIELSPEGELEQFLNRYAVYAGIKLDEGELFIELAGAWDDAIMGEEAQAIFDDFFAKLEAALTQAA